MIYKKIVFTVLIIVSLLVSVSLLNKNVANPVVANAATSSDGWSGESPAIEHNLDVLYRYVDTNPKNELSLLQFGTHKGQSEWSTTVTKTDIIGGQRFDIATAMNKNTEFCYFTIVTSLSLPAYTKAVVEHNFSAGATRTVSNKNATAKMGFQLFQFKEFNFQNTGYGSGWRLDNTVYFRVPNGKDTAVGGACNSAGDTSGYISLLSAMVRDANKSSTTTYFGDSESYSTKRDIVYENDTADVKTVYKYFGFFIVKQYGSSYANQLNAFLTMTTGKVQSTARVNVYKSNAPLQDRNVQIKNDDDPNETYSLVQSASEPGSYLLDSTSVIMDGRKYSVFVDGKDVNVDIFYNHKGSFTKNETNVDVNFWTIKYYGANNNLLSTRVYYSGESVDLSFEPLNYLGYTQIGWRNMETYQAKPYTYIYPKKDYELYPFWQCNVYKVTLIGNGGTGTDLTSYTYNTGATLPTDWTMQCAEFVGWFLSPSHVAAVKQISTSTYGDKTYYARWTYTHKYVTDPAVEPTCTEKGKTEGEHCSVCNKVFVAQTEITAKGHSEVTDLAVEPTCTKKGKTEGKHCSVCNEVLVAQTEIKAKGHVYDDESDNECNVCGYRRAETTETPSIIGDEEDRIWEKGSDEDLILETNIKSEDFGGIYVDGRLLEKSEYEIEDSEVKIGLKKKFLGTLSEGEHTIKIMSPQGAAETTFTIRDYNQSDSGSLGIHWIWFVLCPFILIALLFI